MKLYCGIDLGRTHCEICIINADGVVVHRARVESAFLAILKEISPFGIEMEIVFESCNTWYWLGDGLRQCGYKLGMSHTSLKLCI